LVALGATALGCGSKQMTLSDLNLDSVAAAVGALSEFEVYVTFAGAGADARGGCPVLGSSVTATVNGQAMNVVSLGGVVSSPGGVLPCASFNGTNEAPCFCGGLSFAVDRAWGAAQPDGPVDISIADSSLTIRATVSGALLPNAISLIPPATTTIFRGDTLLLMVAGRTPPLSTLHFTLVTPSGQSMLDEVDLGTRDAGGGAVDFLVPTDWSLGFHQLQATSDTPTSPQVETCQGVATCSVAPTNLVGSLDLDVAN
jgi:hypothetical protein